MQQIPSKSLVRKAGSTLRAFKRGDATNKQLLEAIETIQSYRASFSTPLIKVNNGLRSFLRTLGIDAEVSQRLKRLSTIIDKLTERETGLDLSRMRDIGGCRAVLNDNNIDDLYLIHDHVKKQWGSNIVTVKDYIQTPRESGYRAIHIEISRDGCSIEVQLRTKQMHEWAQTAEAFSNVFGQNFKQTGNSSIQEYMRLISKHAQAEENRVLWSEEDQIALQNVIDDVRKLISSALEEGNGNE